MQLKLLTKFNAAFILKPTEGNLIAPFLDRIVQKQRRETRKEELEITSACQRNMRSREPYVARASEDERKDAHAYSTLLAARGFSTRRSYVTHAVTLIFPTDFRAKERLLAV